MRESAFSIQFAPLFFPRLSSILLIDRCFLFTDLLWAQKLRLVSERGRGLDRRGGRGEERAGGGGGIGSELEGGWGEGRRKGGGGREEGVE